MSEVRFRPFRNFDPPELVRLWNVSYTGRGVASPITPDIFDIAALAHTYFDPRGLIVAEEQDRLVGFIHVGFCVNAEHTDLDHSRAVVCAIVVDPDSRHHQIGSQLLERAEQYARSLGARELFAGPSPERDPFYTGIYGGSRASGFLESHSTIGPFLVQQGFSEHERHGVYQKDLQQARDPINFRLIAIRRKTELRLTDQPSSVDWWWMVRMCRYDYLRFEMFPKNGTEPVAGISVIGLDFYTPAWNERAVGLLDMHVPEQERRKGYAQALLIDLGRRLKDEMITLAEIHVPLQMPEVISLVEGAGFQRIDTGVVYRRDVQ
ncbi:MAG: GNAT family N-acetyltransferase [Planctomycetaceae bacterium]|nr:GNAT family N-acetyltransferase [Planctomycetaceae bacterium]